MNKTNPSYAKRAKFARRDARRERALDRKELRAMRTDEQQLDKLQRSGHGNCRESWALATIIGMV